MQRQFPQFGVQHPSLSAPFSRGKDHAYAISAAGDRLERQFIKDSQIGSSSIRSTGPGPTPLKLDRKDGVKNAGRETDLSTRVASMFNNGVRFPTTPYPLALMGSPHASFNDHATTSGFKTNGTVRKSFQVNGDEHFHTTTPFALQMALGDCDQPLFYNRFGRDIGCKMPAFKCLKTLLTFVRVNRQHFTCVEQLLNFFPFAGNLSQVTATSDIERRSKNAMNVELVLNGKTKWPNYWATCGTDAASGNTLWFVWVKRTDGYEDQEQRATDSLCLESDAPGSIFRGVDTAAPSRLQAKIQDDFKKKYGTEWKKNLLKAQYWRLESVVTTGTDEVSISRYTGPTFVGAPIRVGRVLDSVCTQRTEKDLSRVAIKEALFNPLNQNMKKQFDVMGYLYVTI